MARLKIISSTDPKLTEDLVIGECDCYCHKGGNVMHMMACCHPETIKGILKVQQSFIEEYCKQGGIDKVLVEYECLTSTISVRLFKSYC